MDMRPAVLEQRVSQPASEPQLPQCIVTVALPTYDFAADHKLEPPPLSVGPRYPLSLGASSPPCAISKQSHSHILRSGSGCWSGYLPEGHLPVSLPP